MDDRMDDLLTPRRRRAARARGRSRPTPGRTSPAVRATSARCAGTARRSRASASGLACSSTCRPSRRRRRSSALRSRCRCSSAPMAFQAIAHEDRELATARARRPPRTIICLSTVATATPAEVAAAAPDAPRWLQLYVFRDRDVSDDVIDEALESGFSALVLTADLPVYGIRHREARLRVRAARGERSGDRRCTRSRRSRSTASRARPPRVRPANGTT